MFAQLVLLLFISSNTSTSTTTKPTIADRSIDRLCSGRTGEAASSWRPERRSTAAATCRGWWVGCGGGRRRGARIGGGGGGGEGKDGGVVGGGGGRRAVAALSSTHARSYEQIVIIILICIIRSGWYKRPIDFHSLYQRSQLDQDCVCSLLKSSGSSSFLFSWQSKTHPARRTSPIINHNRKLPVTILRLLLFPFSRYIPPSFPLGLNWPSFQACIDSWQLALRTPLTHIFGLQWSFISDWGCKS